MKHKSSLEVFGIIGLGRFGFALAQALAEAGTETLVVDNSEQRIRQASAFTDNAFTLRSLDAESLREAGVQNCDTVAVCIGEAVDVSILTTLTVLQLGVKRVIAKAMSPEHGAVLERLGAEVVYPERDMALRVARRLTSLHVLEYISLSDTVDITEIRLTSQFRRTTVARLDLRRNLGLNIIALKHEEEITTEITPEQFLDADDVIVVAGRTENIRRFEEFLDR